MPEAPGTQNAGNLGENVPPGPVKVTGKRTANGGVVFTWTYDAPMAGDTFVWRETAGGALHDVAHTRTVRVPAPHPPATVCLQVRVVRADGSNASATFSRPGCVR